MTESPIGCFVVLYGSPVDGFKAHGPFPTADAAGDWGEEQGEGGEWVMQVHPINADSCAALYPWSQDMRLSLIADRIKESNNIGIVESLKVANKWRDIGSGGRYARGDTHTVSRARQMAAQFFIESIDRYVSANPCDLTEAERLTVAAKLAA